jgi:hypothetical protein
LKVGKTEAEEQKESFERLSSYGPWPSSIPGISWHINNQNRLLRTILEKLSDIEKKLDKLEKNLNKT